LYVAVAFALGILLFVLIWAKQRNADDFYRVDGAKQSATGEQFEPLPGPDLDATGDADTRPAPRNEPGDSAHIVETAPSPAPAAQPSSAPTPSSAPEATTATTTSPDSPPILMSSPTPVYPSAALRRGESGEALLRVHVDANGTPYAIDLVRGSGSRLLDRAATDAVRKWRFRPAMSDGQPVAGAVQVPIAFSSGQ
jgi:protein TonB